MKSPSAQQWLCTTAKGYDLVTGWGNPHGTNLAKRPGPAAIENVVPVLRSRLFRHLPVRDDA